MRYSTSLILLPLGAATIIGCSPLNPSAPTKVADANISPVATFGVSADLQSDGDKVVRITSGQLEVQHDTFTRTIELKGTAGMRLSASFESAANFAADDCMPCVPGDPVRLEGTLSGMSLSGTVTFRGRTYQLGGVGNFDANAHLVFTGDSLVMPPFTADGTVTLEAPFRLVTDEINPSKLTIPGSPPAGGVTRYALSGQGLATLVFGKAPGASLWFIRSVVFNFDH